MLFMLMVFCAAGAIVLIGLTAYNEFKDLTQVDHHLVPDSSRFARQAVIRAYVFVLLSGRRDVACNVSTIEPRRHIQWYSGMTA